MARGPSFELAGAVGARGLLVSPRRRPSAPSSFSGLAVFTAGLSDQIEKDRASRDGIRAIELLGKYKEATADRLDKANPLDRDYLENIGGMTKDMETAILGEADFGSQEMLDALQGELVRQGTAVKLVAADTRRGTLEKEALSKRTDLVNETLSKIFEDPDNADFFVEEFGTLVGAVNGAISPELIDGLAEQFSDDVLKARVFGMADQRRFEDARALADAVRGEFDPDVFRNIKGRIREIENAKNTDDRTAFARELGEKERQIVDATSMDQLEQIRRDLGFMDEVQGKFEGAGGQKRLTSLVKQVEAKRTALIKGGAAILSAVEAHLAGSGGATQKATDLAWVAVRDHAQKTGALDPEDVEGFLKFMTTFADREGRAPSEALDRIRNAENSSDVQNMEAAAILVRAFREDAANVNTGTHPRVDYAVALMSLRNMSAGEAAQMVVSAAIDAKTIEQRTLEFDQQFPAYNGADEMLDANVASVSGDGFLFGANLVTSDAQITAGIAATFERTHRLAYRMTGDFDVAQRLAAEWFSQTHGVTEVGGGGLRKLVKHPAENYLPTAAMAHLRENFAERSVMLSELIQAQIDASGVEIPDLLENLDAVGNFSLVADGQTERELAAAARGEDVQPSWQVRVPDEFGVMTPWENPETSDMPLRFIMPTMEELQGVPAYQRIIQDQKRDHEAAKAVREQFLRPVFPEIGSPFDVPKERRVEDVTRSKAEKPVGASRPRGIRNNNPGNIRRTNDRWLGSHTKQTDKNFVQFTAPEFGVRALAKTLITYQTKRGVRTIREAIERWAPPSENDTEAYVRFIASRVGVAPEVPIDFTNPVFLKRMVTAIIRMENGVQPYSSSLIERGVKLATIHSFIPGTMPE